MKLLVIGGTGNVGAHLVSMLSEGGADPRVLTRSAERAVEILPAGTELFVGDLVKDPVAAKAAFDGVDTVFMINPPTASEAAEAMLALCLAQDAGVRRIVYQSVHEPERTAFLPHLAPKLMIEHTIEQSGLEYTIIRPNHFIQNDEMCRDQLVNEGLYVYPIGQIGLSRVDVRDVAAVAHLVLTTEGHGGKYYNVVGPSVLTGEDCAAAWSRSFDKNVTNIGDIARHQEDIAAYVPAWLTYDLGLMYSYFGEHGGHGAPEDVEQVERLLGRPLRTYQAFTDERVAAWTA
jgi:uncharacterized protein YbjT (DUF2867 family)